MKKAGITLLIIALILTVGCIILMKNGHSNNSIFNSPATVDISVDCSSVSNLLVTSETDVTVTNNSSRTHKGVTVRITAYDKNDNIIKEKTTTFERALQPNSSFSKPVTLPAKAKRCNCVVENSNPE